MPVACRPFASGWGLQIDLSAINSSDYLPVPSLLALHSVLTSSSSLLQIDYMPLLYMEYTLRSGQNSDVKRPTYTQMLLQLTSKICTCLFNEYRMAV